MDKLLKVMLAIILTSALVSGVALAGCSGPSLNPAPQVGRPAPDFQLPGLDGQPVSLSDLRGRPVLINFWASWCPACRFEMPFIQEIYEDKEWSDKGLAILAVNIGESPSLVARFMEDYGLSFPVLLGTNNNVSRDYNIRGIPATFFIDKDGIIQDMKIGAFSSKAEIEMRLSKVIP